MHALIINMCWLALSRLWLQEYGAVLEVHESVAVPGGLGLFIRLEQTGDVSQTLLPAGAPICGK